MIVCKFGGTSVADAEAIARLIEIIRSRVDRKPVVVVSAMASVTDRLLDLAHKAENADRATLDSEVAALVERHEQVARAVPAGLSAVDSIAADAADLRRELGCVRGRRLSPAECDGIASRGE